MTSKVANAYIEINKQQSCNQQCHIESTRGQNLLQNEIGDRERPEEQGDKCLAHMTTES